MIEYSFYREVYGGSLIGAEDWFFYEKQAAAQLARYQRLYTVQIPAGTPPVKTAGWRWDLR